MFKVGDKVIINDIPADWGIDPDIIGKDGIIVAMDRSETGITCISTGKTWWFPTKDFCSYVRKNINKWNPLGYKSHFEPLKLP